MLEIPFPHSDHFEQQTDLFLRFAILNLKFHEQYELYERICFLQQQNNNAPCRTMLINVSY